jgi:hypothetical protein
VGKATILSSLGAGQYSIRVEFDNAAVDAKLTAIDAKLLEITAQIEELATAKADALAAFNVDSAALNAYISTTTPEQYIANPAPINALTVKLYASRLAYDRAAHDEKRAKLQKTALEKEKEYLEKYCPSEFDVNAWCIAYNESLSGAIETIECDYMLERDAITNQVRNDTGFWLPATAQAPATQLQHALATSQHAAWFNLCMAPAMQRHQGRYRIATLTSVNTGADTCNLTFDGQYDVDRYRSGLIDNLPILPQFASSEPGVEPAQQLNYTGAAIVYPPCNAEVFQAGDRVIVDLHGGVGAPTVVGFYANPRECAGAFTWSPLYGFESSAIPGGLGIVDAVSGTGPISIYQSAWEIIEAGGSPVEGDLLRTLTADASESDQAHTANWTAQTFAFGSAIITQTYSRTYTSHYQRNTYYPNTQVEMAKTMLITESLTTNMTVGAIDYGDIYTHTITGTMDMTSYVRDAEITSRQFALYDDGTIKATRTYSATGSHDGVTGDIDYTRATTGNLSGIDDVPISGNTSTWSIGHLAFISSPEFAYTGSSGGSSGGSPPTNVLLNKFAWTQ